MDRHFSKRAFFINCAFTLLYTGLVVGAYTDISSCPYTYDPPTDASLRAAQSTASSQKSSCGASGQGAALAEAGLSAVYTHSFERCGVEAQKYLFRALNCGNGLSCHMLDITVWAYIIGLLVFMTQKYIVYRIQGLHYFFLDYCYFHNTVMTIFLLYCLVEVQWSAEPLVRWKGEAGVAYADGGRLSASSTVGGSGSPIDVAYSRINLHLVTGSLVHTGAHLWRWVISVDGLYYPTSVRVLTCGYAMNRHAHDRSFLIFLALLGGAIGPLLGAIIMWRNALLFHAFDRMSSCYLHLLPGIVQGLLLHRLFTSARNEAHLLDPEAIFVRAVQLAWRTNQTVETWLPAVGPMQRATGWSCDALPSAEAAVARPREAQKALEVAKKQYGAYARAHGYNAVCGHGTACFALEKSVTFGNVLQLHFYMFLVWQIFYHTFHESRLRIRMMKQRRRQMRQALAHHEEVMALAGSTAEEAELLRPPTALGEGAGGDPTFRVTSYTWMFEHPPGGKKGLPYRFCTMLGPGRLPTTALFQVTQWILHMIFYAMAYPVLYVSFHRVHKAWPILLHCIAYTLLCVYNAACIDKKWISKLQKMAEKGLDSERLRLSMAQPPPQAPQPKTSEERANADHGGDNNGAVRLGPAPVKESTPSTPSRVTPTPPHLAPTTTTSAHQHAEDESTADADREGL